MAKPSQKSKGSKGTAPKAAAALPARIDLNWRWQVVLLLFAGLVVLHRALLNGTSLGLDDAFITYRFAYNNAHGHWFQWNVGEPPVYGTTTFLYTMILTAVGFLGLSIPWASIVLSALCQIAAAYLAYLLVRRWTDDLSGLLAGILIAADGFGIKATIGMETYLYVGLLLGSLWCYQTARFSWAAVLAALLGITRIDGFLLTGILALHYVVSRKKIPWKPMLVFALIVLPWILTCKQFFGSLLPHTLVAKKLHVVFGAGVRFSLHFVRQRMGAFAGLLLLLTALYGAFRTFRVWRKSSVFLLCVFLMLNVASYFVIGLSEYPWYDAPMVAGAWLLTGIATFYVSKRVRILAMALLCALSLFVSARIFLQYPFGAREYNVMQEEATRWLQNNAKPNESVVAMEVGMIGYYNPQLKVHDLLGLVSPYAVNNLRGGHIVETVAAWNPDYLFLMEGQMFTWPIFHPILWAQSHGKVLAVEDPNWLQKWNHWFENNYTIIKEWPWSKRWWDQETAYYVFAQRTKDTNVSGE